MLQTRPVGKTEIICMFEVRPEDGAVTLSRDGLGQCQKETPGSRKPAVIGRGDFVQTRLQPMAGQAGIDGLYPQGQDGAGGAQGQGYQAPCRLPPEIR